jgi:succinoglycan biosynthesis protein ExoA
MAGPRVTVVVPVRDEASRLGACLDAIAAQDLPRESVEVLVVDGGSTDGTVPLARAALARHLWAHAAVLHCDAGDRSSNLNLGLEQAAAPILVRVDARSRIPRDYVRRCAELLDQRPGVAVVGGRQRAVPAGDRALDAGVARALNNRWGMGLSRYRRPGSPSGETDTVYLGAYRTGQLRAAGGWRTDLAVNEDFDLNRRLARFGTVWFEAGLTVDYLPRASLRGLLGQYWAFGVGKARYWRTSGDRPRPRQLVLLGAPLAGAALLAAALAAFGPGAALGLAGAAIALALAVEVAGADGPRGGVLAHLAALVALSGVAGAWLAGVAVGSLQRQARTPQPVAS